MDRILLIRGSWMTTPYQLQGDVPAAERRIDLGEARAANGVPAIGSCQQQPGFRGYADWPGGRISMVEFP